MDNSSVFQIQAKKLGVLMKDARLASDKSAEDCAKAMGILPSEYENYEQGDNAPSLPELEALGFFLDIPIDHFLNSTPVSFEAKINTLLLRWAPP